MENVNNDSEFFTSGELNAPEYVADFLRSVRPGEEAKKLHNLRQSLTARSNNAADQIKDIVFDHYKQFIDTSKEISKLEKEIYQLSTLLTDQRHLLEGLMEMTGLEKRSSCSASLTTSSGLSSQQTHQLQILMNRMDDIAPILNSAGEQERILLQGQLQLLDSETFKPKHTVYAVLLSNNLLIGHPNPDSGTGQQKHPFHLAANYSLDSLALINVKRTPSNFDESSENIVQLLVFPEYLYLRCENARVKRDWLESVEETKRKQHEERALVRQATIRARRRSILNTIATRASTSDNVRNKKTHNLHEKIDEEEEIEEGKQSELGKRRRMSIEDSVWLNDLINELQDVISHRHMEEAVEMLMEWKSCSYSDAALNARFAAIEKQVVQILTDDLKRFSSVYGGSKVLAQPLQQLIALGRSTYAIELYLKKRSAVLRTAARELIISEEPLSYVRQVSGLFINDIVEVCTELSIYPKQLCLIIAWSSRELGILLSLIRKNVIEVAPTMAVLTNTWRILVGKCSHLSYIGLDLSFEINRLAAPSLRTALQANFDNILESIKLRNSEERWTPFSLDSDQNLIRFLEEMSDIGFQMEWAICRESPSPDYKYRYALNVKWKSCSYSDAALNARFAAIEKQVVQILTDDLKRFSSVYGGSKVLAQPLQQLIALGRSTYAIELYLKKRSAVLRTAARELIISEEPLSYVRQVSGLFINDIVEVCTELSIYPKQLCLIIAWSSRELGILLSLIRKNVIEVAPTMAVLTNTWRILVGKCSHLSYIGLDLSFEINRLAAPSLRTALQANFDNILESIKLRNSEERWTPFSLDSDQNLIRFLEEMSDIGFQMEWAICRESPSPDYKYRYALNVSQNVCMFARIALQLSRDLALLNSSPHLQQISNAFICEIWNLELSHLTSTMHSSIVHHCSSRFIISQVLPLCEQVLQCGDDSEGVLYEILHKKFSHLVHFQRRPSNLYPQDEETDDHNVLE
uniref:Exocyst complex component 8 n=1 Tax=Meloidogyne incognita TaxID=6306 RepID=A0A914MCX0_MELIC